MRSSQRNCRRPTHLTIDRLEDRTVPSGLVADTSTFASNRVLVTFADGTDSAAHRAELARVADTASADHLGFGIYAVTLTSGVSVGSAITLYAGQAGVTTAEPDYVVTADLIPNDPSFPTQWGLNNTGQSGGVADADIDAPEAWNVQTGTGHTIVAVVDTGVDYTHPDLAANMWRNPGEIPGDGIDNDGDGIVDDVYGANFVSNTGNPMDDNEHGTHVAGIIGAVGNNGVGVTGVAWHTQIMAVKFMDASGSGYTSNAVRAINYAVAHGATVLNNSWGGGGADATLANAIGAAKNAGAIFVAAAGNSGANNDTSSFYPANYITQYDNVVTVAAVDRTGALASFSNYGPTRVTLAAPGVSILSTLPNNSYGSLSGTSMATPFVTGAIALLRDQHPDWTYSQVIAKLKSSVDVLPGLAGKVSTGGRLNVAKMLDASTVPPTPPPPTFTSGPKVTAATFNGPNSTTVSSVRFTFNEAVLTSSFSTADVMVFTGPNGTIVPTGVAAVAGSGNTQFDVTFPTQTAAGAYAMTIGPAITDAAGNAMNQNGNTTNGEVPGDRYTASVTLGGSRMDFSAGALPVAIPDLSTVSIPIVVNQDLTVTDLNVVLNVSHTYDSDLVMSLTSPTGVTRTLVNRHGGSGDNYAVTTLDDQATTLLTTGRAPFNGSFRPDQPLSAFNGMNARGTWTLRISDVSRLDTGTANSATLSFTGNPGGQKVMTLALPDDEVTAPTPTVSTATSAAKESLPVLLGVWVTPDDVANTKASQSKPFDWTAALAQSLRAAARRQSDALTAFADVGSIRRV
jgi:subtilisin family serine protease/subtilisin-like proprotein convertase family protein